MRKDYFNEIEGTRIRKQYFNLLLSGLLLFFEIFAVCFTVLEFNIDDFNLKEWAEYIFGGMLVAWLAVLIFAVLSVLNRLFFGETVCVMSEQGIHYKYGFIKWSEVICIKYSIPFVGGNWMFNTPKKITVICKSKIEEIPNVPLYALTVAKKYCKGLKTKGGKLGYLIVGGIFLIGCIIFFLN